MSNSKLLRATLVACVALFARVLGAQGNGEFDPLGVPGATLICRPIPVEPADSAAFEFEFIDGSDLGAQRITLLAFDSVGTPLFMMLYAPTKISSSRQRKYFFEVQFYPDRKGVRLVSGDETTSRDSTGSADSVKHNNPKEETLTTAEIAHAKVLAEWFWTHRCKGSVADR